MTDDLVKRLRDSFVYDQQHYAPDPLVAEAADKIEALTAENERLREALKNVLDLQFGAEGYAKVIARQALTSYKEQRDAS